eukprot:3710089-Prymnesium_polylepis.1
MYPDIHTKARGGRTLNTCSRPAMHSIKLLVGFLLGFENFVEALARRAVPLNAVLLVRRQLLHVLLATVLQDLLERDQAKLRLAA